jgi:replicative DNA helicase
MKYPNCKETENTVISQLFLVPEARQGILNNLDSEDFYQSKLGPVFNALKKIVNNGNQVDVGEVYDSLSEDDRNKFQSATEFSNLIDDSAMALNHGPKIEKLKKLSTKRSQIKLGAALLRRSKNRLKTVSYTIYRVNYMLVLPR